MYSVHIACSFEKSTRSSQPSLLAKTLEVPELVVQHFNFKYCTSWDLRSAYGLKFWCFQKWSSAQRPCCLFACFCFTICRWLA